MNDPIMAVADQALVLQWLVGALVVVLYARDRFRNPRPMRASTTFWRYWSAWCGYVAAMVMLFIVLGGGITAIDPTMLWRLLQVDEQTTALPGPLLSALLLTSLLPHFPLLGKLDEAVKQWFQRVGNIPFEVRELSAHLRSARYEPAADTIEQMLPAFKAHGVEPAWLQEPPDSLRHRWARSVALYTQVQHWEDARGYARYVEENRPALADVRSRLAAQAEILSAATLIELDRDTDSILVAYMRKKIVADMAALQRALCDFASGGVLNRGWNQAQRRMALAELGFSPVPEARGPLNSHDLVLVTGIVFLAMLFVPLMTRRIFDPTPLPMSLRVLVMVPIIYAIAIVVAVYPKSVWAFASRKAGERRPVAAYALSGAIAAAAAFLVSLLFRFAFETPGNVLQVLATPGAFSRAWHLTVERWPWLLMTFFATIAIAWAADDHLPGEGVPPRWLRWVEAAALAAVFGLLQWTVLQLFAAVMPADRVARLLESTARMIFTSVLIGGAIGWYVPHMCRAPGRRPRSAGRPAVALDAA
ncbi:hypothetical protein V4F39_26985 [Aquincola sp. MAHUQ-54]|uniref:Uncharacterized protein n=1 Tax=Aquincola agrisoli TaxID=3119538 RepID=A0AAW9QQB7_9BURK